MRPASTPSPTTSARATHVEKITLPVERFNRKKSWRACLRKISASHGIPPGENARALPRRDAAIVGNVATGTEVKLNQCLTASDGNWCRARVGDTSIWLAMTALRMEEWPIVTFRVLQMP